MSETNIPARTGPDLGRAEPQSSAPRHDDLRQFTNDELAHFTHHELATLPPETLRERLAGAGA